MKRLQNKVALVTGAAQGIGAAIARELLCNGAVVFLSDIDHERGVETVNTLGKNSYYLKLDVRMERCWENALAAIKSSTGQLDILVNNAGVTGYHLPLGAQNPEEATLDSWLQVHQTNLTGTFLGCKYGIAAMKENKTHSAIINISSRSGIVGIPHAAAYASSKAAIRNHTKSVALYCAEKNYPITCNSIHPAAIRTPMWEQMLNPIEDPEVQLQRMAAQIPLKQFGTPRDVAYAAVYLASNEASYITGIELNIDGGILAGAAASPTSN
ncbi:SDR family oxidoreductase [Flavihumibacter profundi]|uniref:SDR family oxidoreductase n=1 Tax=Flavihumibacter profundi TaxID=2716883 RepID=UPI001CC5A996|nr:SDR family oxidoreductase [Flavihumibacter profundi]MBZ5857708.1 SDR family oxidoreductase [Flavihumibacter profundi]